MKKILLISVLLASCSPVYIPNSRNSPMFKSRGEFQASGSFGNGLEAQAALSVTEHLGFISNFSYIDRQAWTDGNSDTDKYLRHRFFEGGIGYFENKEKMFFEIFAGFGKGEGTSFDNYALFGSEDVLATGKYNRYFLQPAFGFNHRRMNVSFVPRLALVDFTEFSVDHFRAPVDEDPILFFEPAVIGRLNFANDRIMFIFQGGFSGSLNGGRYFDHRPFQFSTGLGFRLGGLKRGVFGR